MKRSEKVSATVSLADLQDGQLKEVDLGGTPVLVLKDGDKLSAIGAKCTHYGAPLKTGALSNGRVRCPWHGACFNTTTGDIEDYPACGSLPVFQTSIEGGNVVIEATKGDLEAGRVFKTCNRDASDQRTFVVIGGGAAGSAAVQTLRGSGYKGRLILISRENVLPYDRVKVSKAMDVTVDKLLLNGLDYFQNSDVELMLGTEVIELDGEAKSIKTSAGTVINYDKVLVATGADPQKLAFLKGHDGKNVYTLRTPEQANTIFSIVEGKRVAIVGSSFIGMEVAAAIVKKAAQVTVVGMEKVPFERVLGLQVGGILQKLHEANKVTVTMGVNVQEFLKNSDGMVTALQLKEGPQIAADIFIIGAGAVPATGFIKEHPSIKRERDRSIICNQWLEIDGFQNSGIYVAGDSARWPLNLLDGKLVRIEHWGMAQTTGSVAASNMLQDKSKSISNHVPVFWTTQYGKGFRYAGHALEYDEQIFDDGKETVDPLNPKFAVYYVFKGKVVALLTVQRDPLVAMFSEIVHAGILVSSEEIKNSITKTGNSTQAINELFAKAKQH